MDGFGYGQVSFVSLPSLLILSPLKIRQVHTDYFDR